MHLASVSTPPLSFVTGRMTLSPNQQLRALNQVQNICDIQVQAQLCLTITMSLCRYNKKTAVSSSICKHAHWYNSLSADSTLYDASSYSNYYVLWCIIRVSLGASLLFLLHESQLLFTAVEVTVTCDIYADDCTSAWQWSHQTATSTSSDVCGRSHQPGSGLIRQQLSTSSAVSGRPHQPGSGLIRQQLSTSSAVCGRSHQPGSGLIRQQLSTSSAVCGRSHQPISLAVVSSDSN